MSDVLPANCTCIIAKILNANSTLETLTYNVNGILPITATTLTSFRKAQWISTGKFGRGAEHESQPEKPFPQSNFCCFFLLQKAQQKTECHCETVKRWADDGFSLVCRKSSTIHWLCKCLLSPSCRLSANTAILWKERNVTMSAEVCVAMSSNKALTRIDCPLVLAPELYTLFFESIPTQLKQISRLVRKAHFFSVLLDDLLSCRLFPAPTAHWQTVFQKQHRLPISPLM